MAVRGIVGYQVEYLGVIDHESPVCTASTFSQSAMALPGHWNTDNPRVDWEDTLQPIDLEEAREEVARMDKARKVLEEKERAEREVALAALSVLDTERIPRELVLRTLAARATNALPELTLQDETTLPNMARRLLARGASDDLVTSLETMILESVPIDIAGLTFTRQGAGTTAQFPQFSVALLSKIRTLFIPIDIAPQSQYPARLFRVTASMASLQQQLSNLHLLIVLVRFRYRAHTPLMGDRLKGMCTPIGTGQITLREALERLVTAMQANRVGRRQVLQLGWEVIDFFDPLKRTRMPTFTAVNVDQRGAGELVELATTTSNANGTPNALG
ncbi:hypothetical protein LTR17_001947 [Elasticomyces elasticus]|nr:hypothetical protein LTR17_001947 [Elasticomyces elasticus]